MFSPLLFEFCVEKLQKLTVSEIFTKNMIFERRHLSIGTSKLLRTFAMVLMLVRDKLQTNVYDLQQFRGPYDHHSSGFSIGPCFRATARLTSSKHDSKNLSRATWHGPNFGGPCLCTDHLPSNRALARIKKNWSVLQARTNFCQPCHVARIISKRMENPAPNPMLGAGYLFCASK